MQVRTGAAVTLRLKQGGRGIVYLPHLRPSSACDLGQAHARRLVAETDGEDGVVRVQRRGRGQEAWTAPPTPAAPSPAHASYTVPLLGAPRHFPPSAGKFGTSSSQGQQSNKPFPGTESGHICPHPSRALPPPKPGTCSPLTVCEARGQDGDTLSRRSKRLMMHDTGRSGEAGGRTPGGPRVRWPWARPGLWPFEMAIPGRGSRPSPRRTTGPPGDSGRLQGLVSQ